MNEIIEIHKSEYGVAPLVVSKAPGVIRLFSTLWGEFRGRVLEGAINHYVSVSISLREDDEVHAYHVSFKDAKKAGIKSPKYKKDDKWFNYVKGMIFQLDRLGCEVKGMDITINSEIPKLLGLNSSTATCVALAIAMRSLFNFELDDIQLLQAAYLVEYSFMETETALLIDCLTCYYSKPNCLVYYDSHSVDFLQYDISSYADHFFLVDSRVKTLWEKPDFVALFQFAKDFQAILDREKIPVLLNISEIDFDASDFKTKSLDEVNRLMTHIVQEKQRIEDSRTLIEGEKWDSFGRLLNASHTSLGENLNLSAPEVDWLNKRIMETPGVLGCRLVGLGHGGCLLVLSDSPKFELDEDQLVQYEHIFGYKAKVVPLRFDGVVTLNNFKN